jgi:protein FrlC
MISLAYSTNGFTQRGLIPALAHIQKIGYQSVEILADRPHYDPAFKNTKALVQALKDLNLSISNINGNTTMFLWPESLPETIFEPALSNIDPKIRRKRIDVVKELLHWGKELSAPTVSITSGRAISARVEDLKSAFVESLSELCEEAQKLDIQLSIEYEPGLLIENAKEVLEIIHRVNHPKLKVNLDLGHAQCAFEDPCQVIQDLAPHIANFHIEDILDRKHYHLIPGEGNMPFSEIFQTIHRLKPNAFVTVELYTESSRDIFAAQKAFDFLSRLI